MRLNTDDPINMPITDSAYGRRRFTPTREHEPRGHTFPIRVSTDILDKLAGIGSGRVRRMAARRHAD